MKPAEPIGRRARKRRDLLDRAAATAGALFRRDGYEAVTMEQIAEAADVARGTLYNHFPTKDALLAAWIHQELARDLSGLSLDVGANEGFAASTAALLDRSARWCVDNRRFLLPYLRFRFLKLRAPAEAACDSSDSFDSSDDAHSHDSRPDDSDDSHDSHDPHDSDTLVAFYARLIRDSQRRGEMRRDLDAGHLAVMFHHLYLAALLRWLAAPALDLRQAFAQAVDVFLHGCVLAPGHSPSMQRCE
ncbi:MAG: TetR/AcrR family transcriptional regulator [Burkholderiaceae bacterium]